MYIDDLNPQCVVHMFIDDTTLTEILLKGNESAHSRMPQYLDNLLTSSTNNWKLGQATTDHSQAVYTTIRSARPQCTAGMQYISETDAVATRGGMGSL